MIEVFISPTGDDDLGEGTFDDPWLTLQKAHDDANGSGNPVVGGDFITCRGGTYSTTFSTDEWAVIWSASGTSGNIITVRNRATETPIFQNSSRSGGFLKQWGASTDVKFVTFDGLKFDYWKAVLNIACRSTEDI